MAEATLYDHDAYVKAGDVDAMFSRFHERMGKVQGSVETMTAETAEAIVDSAFEGFTLGSGAIKYKNPKIVASKIYSFGIDIAANEPYLTSHDVYFDASHGGIEDVAELDNAIIKIIDGSAGNKEELCVLDLVTIRADSGFDNLSISGAFKTFYQYDDSGNQTGTFALEVRWEKDNKRLKTTIYTMKATTIPTEMIIRLYDRQIIAS